MFGDLAIVPWGGLTYHGSLQLMRIHYGLLGLSTLAAVALMCLGRLQVARRTALTGSGVIISNATRGVGSKMGGTTTTPLCQSGSGSSRRSDLSLPIPNFHVHCDSRAVRGADAPQYRVGGEQVPIVPRGAQCPTAVTQFVPSELLAVYSFTLLPFGTWAWLMCMAVIGNLLLLRLRPELEGISGIWSAQMGIIFATVCDLFWLLRNVHLQAPEGNPAPESPGEESVYGPMIWEQDPEAVEEEESRCLIRRDAALIGDFFLCEEDTALREEETAVRWGEPLPETGGTVWSRRFGPIPPPFGAGGRRTKAALLGASLFHARLAGWYALGRLVLLGTLSCASLGAGLLYITQETFDLRIGGNAFVKFVHKAVPVLVICLAKWLGTGTFKLVRIVPEASAG